MVGATGLEPATLESEHVENRRFTESRKTDANAYANNSPENPLEKLAQAWETLPPEVQAKIAELVEQATEEV